VQSKFELVVAQPRTSVPHGSLSSAPPFRQLTQALTSHIVNVAGHYAGKVYCWDVVNEAVSDSSDPSEILKPTIWYPALPDYLDLAFHTAHAADPHAKLFYNDYSAEGFSRCEWPGRCAC
jgi:GH35 family endo-1,4-beta-xylanase